MTSTNDSKQLADHELDELCRILIGADRNDLRAAIERLQQRGQFVDWQSQTLADAMRLALARDPAFAESMGTMISKGVHTTVQRDSAAFGRALAPAMGPAIRNAVWMMLQGFVQSIEAIVDQQLSWRSVRWRIEAWRTGRSYAEIAFVHTLLFRVEHVFLLHRESGLQLLHAARTGVTARDPDLIAAMLSAIQDFLRDAFEAREDDSATSFSINELAVIVESGNHASLATVVRGQPRAAIRLQLREALDRIETTMAGPLSEFSGETAHFEAVLPQLEACLTESQRNHNGKAAKRQGSSAVRWGMLTAAVALITWWVIASAATASQRARFGDLVATLHEEPGYVITNSRITDTAVVVHGLRDPLARAFTELASEHSVANLATAHWQDYHALHEPFVAHRVRQTLQLPPDVTFALSERKLILIGTASHAWLARTAAIAVAIDGIEAVDLSGCQDRDLLAYEAAAARLLALDPTLTELQDPTSRARTNLAQLMRELTAHAIRIERRWTMQASFVWWNPNDTSPGARAARELIADLSRLYGMSIQLRDYISDQGVADATLRFVAKLID